jgi:hypothetical protein
MAVHWVTQFRSAKGPRLDAQVLEEGLAKVCVGTASVLTRESQTDS